MLKLTSLFIALVFSLTVFPRSKTSLEGKLTDLQWNEIRKGKVVLARIPKGSILIKINNKKKFTAPRDINTYVYQIPDGQGYQYIISSRSKKVKFKVYKTYVTDISAVSNLQPEPKVYEEAPPRL